MTHLPQVLRVVDNILEFRKQQDDLLNGTIGDAARSRSQAKVWIELAVDRINEPDCRSLSFSLK